MYQIFRMLFSLDNDTMILFLAKKTFFCTIEITLYALERADVPSPFQPYRMNYFVVNMLVEIL